MGYAGAGLASQGLQPPKLAARSIPIRIPAPVVCVTILTAGVTIRLWPTTRPWSTGVRKRGFFGCSRRIPPHRVRNTFTGDPEDWSFSQGTISFWFKRDTIFYGDGSSSGDRLWGQNVNMESRFNSTGTIFSLDWGSGGNAEGAINAANPFTGIGTWYFIAITWADATDHLQVYWGNET